MLWTEDFAGEATNATSGVAGGSLGGTWSVTVTPSGGTNTFSRGTLAWFRINGTGSEGEYRTNVVDISTAGYAVVTSDIVTTGFGFTDSDYVRFYYRVDGGSEVLFAEVLGSFLSATTSVSAIVAGSTIEIIVRGVDNSFFGVVGFDNLTITSAPVIYSRKSGNWDDVTGGAGGTGTWSVFGFTGSACGCTPLTNQVAIIGNGFTVDMNVDGTVGALDIQNTGTLRYTNANIDLGIEAGLVRVRNGGTINRNGQNNSQIDFNQDIGGAVLQVDAGGIVTIDDVTLTTNATNFHYLDGGGSLSISDDILLGADGGSLTNNMTTSVTVGDRIELSTGTTDGAFVNNGTLTANSVVFSEADNSVTNTGTLSVQSITIVANNDDNNVFTNSGTLNLSGATSIDAASADFFINNSGVINQSGNFANLIAASDFTNQTNGIWNWNFVLASLPANINSVLVCTATNNTFNYSASGNQVMAAVTYHHLGNSGSGTKTLTGNTTANGNLSISGSATTSPSTFNFTISGTTAITGGTFTDGNNTGTNIFVGNVSVGTGTSFVTTSVTTTANLVFRGGVANAGTFTAGGATFNTNPQSLTGGSSLSFANNVAITGATVTNSNTGNLTISGTTTLSTSGGFTDADNTGVTTLVGNVSVGASTSFISTAVTTPANLVFRGGIANAGTFTGGAATFNTSNQSITGTTALSFANNVAITAITLTVSNSSNLTVSGTTTLTTSGGFTDSNNTGITTFGGNVSVGASTTFTSTTVTTVGNMVFQGGIANTGTFSAGGATFNTNNQSLTGSSAFAFANNVAITGVTVTNSNTSNLTVTGTTTLSTAGGFTDSDNSGSTIFVGLVTVGASTSFISTAVTTNGNMVFRGGITNNGGTFTAGAGNFNTNSQSLAGTADISFANFVNITGVTVTNNNSQSVSLTRVPGAATLTGTGTWTQGAGSTLNYTGTSISVTTFNSSAAGNTVNYSCNNAPVTIRNSSTSSYHHLTLSGSGNQTKSLAANTVVNGNLTILNTAIFSVSTFTLSVAGNWSNSSTDADPFVQGTQTVTLNGTTAQTITNTGDAQGTEFNNVTINNTFGTSPQITLNNAVTVNGALTLTQGIVSTSSGALLTLPDNATSSPGDADSYVDGPMRKIGNDAFVFPTGDGTIWARIGISAPATATTEFTAQYFDANFGSVDKDLSLNDPSDNEYWTLDRAVTTDGVRVTLFWENNVRSQIDDAVSGDLVVARFTSGSFWTSEGQFSIASAGATGSVTSNVVTTFSPFTFGSLSAPLNPLPVELISFHGFAVQREVHLDWVTASELNNDYFVVERSATGEVFQALGQVKGNGTTRNRHAYAFVDASPVNGTAYYRLKQTDYDGTFAYSNVISVTYESSQVVLHLFPNPSAGRPVHVQVHGLATDVTEVPIHVVDALGRTVYQGTIQHRNLSGIFEEQSAWADHLPEGTYLVKVGTLMGRVMITRN